jgi:DNA-binding NarL/FixJ family response regulator
MPTRVMLVEDHADFRYVMTVLLAREPDLEKVARADPLDEARQHCTSVGDQIRKVVLERRAT